MEEIEEFSTRDIDLASALVLHGFEIENIIFQVEGNNSRIIGYFIFKRTEELTQTIKDFENDRLMVSPRQFSFQQKALRNRVFRGGDAPYVRTRTL